jgi:hypothetical protein
MFILGEGGRSAYGIIKMLWESTVKPDEGAYILRFRQADLNLEASGGL